MDQRPPLDVFDQFNRAKADFLNVDLDTARTFAEIARGSQDEEKIARNRRNARKAYDTVVHFLATATLTRLEEESIRTKLGYLKNALVDLGESF